MCRTGLQHVLDPGYRMGIFIAKLLQPHAMISLCLCCFNRYPGFGRIFCSLAVCSLCVCWCELPRIGALMLYEHMRFISLYGKSLLGLRSVEAPSSSIPHFELRSKVLRCVSSIKQRGRNKDMTGHRLPCSQMFGSCKNRPLQIYLKLC